jgi:hypothetical protein
MICNQRITQRDRDIVKFVEKYKAITIAQCQEIFMSDATFGYKIAQRRLGKLVDNGYLKVSRTDSNENLYFIDKKISYHDVLINSFYAELVKCKATIKHVEHDKRWIGTKPKSDAFFWIEYGGTHFFFILEIALTHKDIPIADYEQLYRSGELQKIFLGRFPTIVVMDDADHKKPDYYHSDIIKIVQIDFALKKFPLIFV